MPKSAVVINRYIFNHPSSDHHRNTNIRHRERDMKEKRYIQLESEKSSKAKFFFVCFAEKIAWASIFDQGPRFYF